MTLDPLRFRAKSVGYVFVSVYSLSHILRTSLIISTLENLRPLLKNFFLITNNKSTDFMQI